MPLNFPNDSSGNPSVPGTRPIAQPGGVWDGDQPIGSIPEADLGRPSTGIRPSKSWPRRVWIICFAIFALEIGLFLTFFPWMEYWEINPLRGYNLFFQTYWTDAYFRGAVSGLGLLNVYIALTELMAVFPRRIAR